MKWISNLFGKYWRNVHLSAILVLSLVLIFGGSRVTGLVNGVIVTTFHYPFFKIKTTVEDLLTVNQENERLQLALVEASRKLSLLGEIERENLRLRTVLGFEPPAGYTLVPAKVIATIGEGLPIAAIINRGTTDSILVDQPLINEQGLIGRIISVSPHTATVQLLTDPAHRAAVRVADSREMGIVKYRVSDGLILDNFPVQGSIVVGNLLMSSGLGGIYPPGLVVGTITSVVRPEDEPFCEIRVESAANFNSLEELFVLKASSL